MLCAICCVMQSCEEKSNALLLHKKIVKHNKYEAIDSLSQT